MLGCACIFAAGCVTAFPFLLARYAYGKDICYPHDEQLMGLDFIYFGGSAYPDLDLEVTSAVPPTLLRSRQNSQSKHGGASVEIASREREGSESSTHSEKGGNFGMAYSSSRMNSQSSMSASQAGNGGSTRSATNFSSDALDVILADDSLRKKFRQFLSQHHMGENVRFLDATNARSMFYFVFLAHLNLMRRVQSCSRFGPRGAIPSHFCACHCLDVYRLQCTQASQFVCKRAQGDHQSLSIQRPSGAGAPRPF